MFVKKGLYVKENLTPRKFKLFKATKEFAQRESYKFVWTRDGEVYIRKDENSTSVLIRNLLSLYSL